MTLPSLCRRRSKLELVIPPKSLIIKFVDSMRSKDYSRNWDPSGAIVVWRHIEALLMQSSGRAELFGPIFGNGGANENGRAKRFLVVRARKPWRPQRLKQPDQTVPRSQIGTHGPRWQHQVRELYPPVADTEPLRARAPGRSDAGGARASMLRHVTRGPGRSDRGRHAPSATAR